MRQVFGCAVLVIAGIAAFIEASSHHPVAAFGADVRCESGEACHSAHGLSETAYDLIRRGSSRAATSTRSSPISEGLAARLPSVRGKQAKRRELAANDRMILRKLKAARVIVKPARACSGKCVRSLRLSFSRPG